jgi:hypothetical protein
MPETEKIKDQVNDHEVRVSLLEQAVRALKDDLDKINANLSKLVWIAGSSLLAAMVNWALKGGLFT